MHKITSFVLTVFVLFLGLLPQTSFGQEGDYKVACIGFYNLENLFDTLDSENTRDTEFTPSGSNRYNTRIYLDKLKNLSSVIAELGTKLTPDGAAILGVSEIENRSVLEDLVKQPIIASRNYQIVHYDSPDFRGIDNALLYQEKYFKDVTSKRIPLMLYRDSSRIYTRDVLLVSGVLDGQELHILVNHWPSRRGGESATAPLRNAAARLNIEIADSLLAINPHAGIIIMGDLNDNPNNDSVKKYIKGKRKINKVNENEYFNPMWSLYKKGIGTTAWQDAWSLFDQILISQSLLSKGTGYHYYKTKIHNEPYLVQKMGHYKGYPFRTWSSGNYLGGYSDHFPVYVYLISPNVK